MGFRKTTYITRYGNGSYVDGVWTEGTTSSVKAKISVQPLRPIELQALPEGRRSGKVVKIYSDVKLISSNKNTNADKFTWSNTQFEVISCEWYQSSVIPHFLAYAVEVVAN